MSKIDTKEESIKRLLYKYLKTYTPFHIYIYGREKINKAQKYIIFSSPYISHRELFKLDQKGNRVTKL